MRPGHFIRTMDPHATAEVALVAARMRETLIEVLGEEAGRTLYTMDWLRQRVLWHLDPAACTGEVFLAVDRDGGITGHTIVRIDRDEAGACIGLFSTTFVDPGSRNQGIARSLLERGEHWMGEHGLSRAVTYTSVSNIKLQNLFLHRGYALVDAANGFVRLSKKLLGTSLA